MIDRKKNAHPEWDGRNDASMVIVVARRTLGNVVPNSGPLALRPILSDSLPLSPCR